MLCERQDDGASAQTAHRRTTNADEKTEVLIKEGVNNKFKTAYAYFKNGWLKQVTGSKYASGWSDLAQVDFTYDKLGQRLSRKNNGTTDYLTKYEFNNRGDLTAVKHRNGGDTADKYVISYGRDAVGNPLQASFSGADVPSVYAGQTLSYSYDAISRLTGESVSGGASSSWTYDWVGNRDPGTYDYNLVDELEPGVDYEYDMKGALEYIPTSTASPRKRFYYSPSELLAQVNSGSAGGTWETSFYWDGDDQRLTIYSPLSGFNGMYWRELYDTTASVPAVLVERKEYQDEDFNDIMLEVFYVREPGGELLGSYDGTNTRYYHFDALGSTVDVTDGAGSSVGSYAYGAWGNLAGTTGATVYPYLYVGQLGYYTHTSDQGVEVQSWLNLGVRFYDPEIGRFERRDPLTNIYHSGPYAYSEDSPGRFVDPTGYIAYCENILKVPTGRKTWQRRRPHISLGKWTRTGPGTQLPGRPPPPVNPGQQPGFGIPVANVICQAKRLRTITRHYTTRHFFRSLIVCINECGRTSLTSAQGFTEENYDRTTTSSDFYDMSWQAYSGDGRLIGANMECLRKIRMLNEPGYWEDR